MSMGGNPSRISNPQMNADERRGGMILNAPMCWFALALCGVGSAVPLAAADDVVALRQQYNQVSASIDTLVRLYGGDKLRELAKRKDNSRLLPANSKLVLIFWADDEAELFLNGHRIGETRLTPTRIEIPVVYLRKSNVLRAHCWDTDRVESGFMAGLYLQDGRGRLRKVLATGDGRWWVAGQRAEPRFYNHSLPDIPGAEVIWGTKLFGEVELEARFDAAQLARAARRRPLSGGGAAQHQPMETHMVVSRLVHLQKQRDELARKLHARRSSAQDVLYEGFVRGRLAFSLGKASRLAEVKSIDAAKKLLAWTEALPDAQRELVFPKKQALKGVGHVVPQRTVVGAASGETDRRRDYAPPAARGSTKGGGRATGSGVQEPFARGVRSVRSTPWALWGIATGLLFYLGVVSRQWWRLLSAKGWTS